MNAKLISRRSLIKTGAAALGISVVFPLLTRGYALEEKTGKTKEETREIAKNIWLCVYCTAKNGWKYSIPVDLYQVGVDDYGLESKPITFQEETIIDKCSYVLDLMGNGHWVSMDIPGIAPTFIPADSLIQFGNIYTTFT